MNLSIIELKLSELSNIFIIWGQNDVDDFFLVDKENRIYGFSSVENIKNFMSKGEAETFPINKEELSNSKQLFSNEVNFYSFVEVEETLSRNMKIDEIDEDDAGVLIQVYNLISDFFYQTDNEECLLLRKDENMIMFFDYCYYKYFWNKGEEWIDLEKRLYLFDYSKFVNNYKKLIGVFVKSIKMVEM